MIIKNNGVDPYRQNAIDTMDSAKKTDQAQKNQGNRQAQVVKNDTVSLSDNAKLRTQAYSTAMSSPDTRSDKVAKLKEQVSNGTYTTNSLRTAKAMISDMLSGKDLFVSR